MEIKIEDTMSLNRDIAYWLECVNVVSEMTPVCLIAFVDSQPAARIVSGKGGA